MSKCKLTKEEENQIYDVDLFLDICNDITIKHPRANP